MSFPSAGDGRDRTTNRRRLLRGLGVAGLAGIAGCTGRGVSDEDGETTSTASDTRTTDGAAETRNVVQELAWLTNQTLPVLPLQEKLTQTFLTTDDWEVPGADSTDVQMYWPTEWLPRMGEWQATGGDDRLTLPQWFVPTESQYNPWNGENYADGRRMLFDRFMQYNLVTDTFSGYAVSNWRFADRSLALTVRDGMQWHDGDAVTASDAAVQLKLDMYAGGGLADYVTDTANDGEFGPRDVGPIADSVSVVDERTVEIDFAQDVNERIVLSYLQPKRLVGKESEYGRFVDAFERAESAEAVRRAADDLAGHADREPVGCGPFRFENADDERTLLTAFDGHPDAADVAIPAVEYRFMPTNDDRWDALADGELDGAATLFMPEDQLTRLSDDVESRLIPRHWGLGLVFDHEDDDVGRKNVRKALACVIEREGVAERSDGGTNSKVSVDVPCGLTGTFSGQIEGNWLDGVTDRFDRYRTDHERAAALLREEGYTREGGSWLRPDGDPLSIPVKAPAGFSDWVAGGEAVVEHLSAFGIEAELVEKDTATYWDTDYGNGEFTVAMQGWANYDHSYPYFHFDWIFQSGDATDIWNVPSEWEAPPLSDPGATPRARNPSGLLAELSRESQQ